MKRIIYLLILIPIITFSQKVSNVYYIPKITANGYNAGTKYLLSAYTINKSTNDIKVNHQAIIDSAFGVNVPAYGSMSETDPVYSASSWFSTTNNSSNWNTAFGWGNHASAGYLTSYTESDPIAVQRSNHTGTQLSSTISDFTETARGTLSFAAGSGAYNNSTGVITIPTNTNQLTNGAGFITSYTETDPIVRAINGMVQSNGTTLSAATSSSINNVFGTLTNNLFYASPNGSAGTPTFRAIGVSDIPTLNQNTTGSAATLTTGRTFSLSGDATGTSGSFNGSANATIPMTLATVNSNIGTFGSATEVAVITVNAKGLITAVSTATISGGGGGISQSDALRYQSLRIL